MNMQIKKLRKEKGLTQVECSKYVGIPLKTYWRYETNESKVGTFKYQYIVNKLLEYNKIDEEHGILSIPEIISITSEIFKNYKVEFAYLFGSYAKNSPKENSDIDILVSTSINGIEFYELIEVLHESLHKKIDLLEFNQLNNNLNLTHEILKTGIKIY